MRSESSQINENGDHQLIAPYIYSFTLNNLSPFNVTRCVKIGFRILTHPLRKQPSEQKRKRLEQPRQA